MPTNLVAATVLSLQLVLPAFDQFADRAELGLRLPLVEKRLTKSHVGRSSPSLMAIFDDRHQFNWNSSPTDTYKGSVGYYDNQNSVPRMERSKLPELAKQKSLLSTIEAKEIAEQGLKNLGYDLKKVKAGPPVVRQWTYDSQKPGEESVPLPAFGLRWFPKGKKNPHWSEVLVEMEVSGLTKKVTRFTASPAAVKAVAVDLRQFMTNRTDKPRAP